MNEFVRLYKLVRKDLMRFAVMALIATAVLKASAPIAIWAGHEGIGTAGLWTAMSIYGVGFVPVLRRLLFDYIDLRVVFERALSADPGRVFVGVCLVVAALVLSLAGGRAQASELPPGAVKYLPVLKAKQVEHWPDMPLPSALAGQVEKESCISLKHHRCWNPRAELRTSRERGVGFGQITKTARFDALAEMRAAFPRQLDGWSWETDALYDPAYQLSAVILMDLRNWRTIVGTSSDMERLAMTLAAYNGGLGGLTTERQLCRSKKGCDPSRWFGHVEHTSLKSRKAAPGYGKSFFAINREYAPSILFERRLKYAPMMDD